ncbi:NAD-dependent epimerase/dehydratase family protein [Streptomyces sp. NPDC001389]|uniref:NAD-dependent epimerase/dehydratase family protein n=1 Tax=Streptomyces sp. NPDC001389 TaxID=3364569 RepID=UPI00369F8808
MTVLITGAAGAIGTDLTQSFAAAGVPLRLLDRRRPPSIPAGAGYVNADLRDPQAITEAAAGTSAIIHLAGNTQNAPFPDVVEHNITGTYNVLEAARHHRIPRVVLASSHHAAGLRPTDQAPDESVAFAPDSFYGVSKVTMEALGFLYAHKHGLSVVALRIGSYRPRPNEPRHRATWLSPRDAFTLIQAAATRTLPVPFLTVYATSANTERWWPRDGWEELGYHPQDNAADHPSPGPITEPWRGGIYAEQSAGVAEHQTSPTKGSP